MNPFHSRKLLPALCALAMLASVAAVQSADEKQGPIFVFIEENDLLSYPFSNDHQDHHYTHGIKFVYIGGDNRMPRWTKSFAEWLPAPGMRADSYNLGLVLGQNMYTPQDILATNLITDDRPYAGWLYTGAVLLRRGVTPTHHIPVMDSFELDLGIVGPEALAGEGQRTVHSWRFPDDIPQGWHNQLKTEPGLLLKGARLWRLSPGGADRFVDLIPHVGAQLGNIQVSAAAGATLRLGWNLPRDFGIQTIDSTASVHGGTTSSDPSFGFHVFGRAEGRAVARNLFLDGNSFRDGPNVEKEPFVTDFSWGFAFQITRHIELGYLRIIRSEEFKGQRGHDVFGTFLLKAKFTF
jgi:lipid A 3-O-deacylase